MLIYLAAIVETPPLPTFTIMQDTRTTKYIFIVEPLVSMCYDIMLKVTICQPISHVACNEIYVQCLEYNVCSVAKYIRCNCKYQFL